MPSGVVTEVQINKQDQQKPADMSSKSEKNITESTKDSKNDEDEGVEVVLGDEKNARMATSPPRTSSQDQGVFRPPQAVRPHATRASSGGQTPYSQSSGSWGYGLPPPPPPSYGRHHYPHPAYSTAAPSFDDPAYHHHSSHTSHYSPSVSYPGYRSSEEVNVISPNHKEDPHYRPPHTPRSRNMPPPNYYYYPPTSPVSRDMMAPGTPGMSRGRSHPPIRRGGAEGPYSRAQRGEYPPHDDSGWSRYPVAHSPGRPHPQVVTESSFDSEHISRESQSHASHPSSHPPTPRSSHPRPPPPSRASSDPHYQFYGGGGSWGSFDSTSGPPPHFDDQRYYGFPPPDPSYGAYHHTPYSPPEIYGADSFSGPPGAHPVYSGHHHPPPHPSAGAPYPYSYDEDERKGYPPDDKDKKGRTIPRSSKKNNSSNMLLPKAAEEVDFDVTDPPLEPQTPPSDKAVCGSLVEVNGYDVLCGRGGGTNSQVGNRRFRKLVQEFQPTYLLARRKEKPLLARSIVLIIRKRGGRFLKKDDETGELFEVGDAKAEAKTSQALREGLDVRATKSAASSLLEKKKKKQMEEDGKGGDDDTDDEELSPKSKPPASADVEKKSPTPRDQSPASPTRHPGDDIRSEKANQHSPEHYIERKRRRTRTATAPSDRFFPEFCPPRADLACRSSPGMADDDSIALTEAPGRRSTAREDSNYENPRGCAGIAFDIMTGAATGSFCLGPSGWRS